MAKNDNAHSVRLYESLKKNVSEEAANEIAETYPLSKAADIEKRFDWAQNVCEELTKKYDDSTVKKVRMDCACGPEEGKIGKLKKLYESCSSVEEFVEKANKLEQGFTIGYKDNALFLTYPQCYCSCVKRIDKPIGKAWCYCTVGYATRMFQTVLSKAVTVELLESVKMGDKQCVMKISY